MRKSSARSGRSLKYTTLISCCPMSSRRIAPAGSTGIDLETNASAVLTTPPSNRLPSSTSRTPNRIRPDALPANISKRKGVPSAPSTRQDFSCAGASTTRSHARPGVRVSVVVSGGSSKYKNVSGPLPCSPRIAIHASPSNSGTNSALATCTGRTPPSSTGAEDSSKAQRLSLNLNSSLGSRNQSPTGRPARTLTAILRVSPSTRWTTLNRLAWGFRRSSATSSLAAANSDSTITATSVRRFVFGITRRKRPALRPPPK